ncbi:hypothetical protein CQA02_14795 [Klebsiella variicola]|nr:hypothetical protein [Klebsiella variicola]PCO70982.1 hypothetical protein CQA02_14795 [Klebsiella variicola]
MHETEKTEFRYELFKRLQYATHIVRRDTGLEIKNRLEIASFYGYMRDQYTSYSAKDLEFFESMESMGLKFQNTDRRTVKKWLDVLNAIGLVISDKRGKDERGYDRYYHTVIPLEEIADNLLFYGSASISGGLLAEGMLIRSLEKKKPRGKPKQKSEDKQVDGSGHEECATQAEQAATADPSINLAPEPAQDDSEQRSGMESDTERGSDAGTDGNHAMSQEAQDDEPTFPPEKPELQETAGRVIAPLDDLRYWSDIGYEGMDDYGVMWGVSGDDLDNLIREHLKIREAEAEKNFKSQRAH